MPRDRECHEAEDDEEEDEAAHLASEAWRGGSDIPSRARQPISSGGDWPPRKYTHPNHRTETEGATRHLDLADPSIPPGLPPEGGAIVDAIVDGHIM